MRRGLVLVAAVLLVGCSSDDRRSSSTGTGTGAGSTGATDGGTDGGAGTDGEDGTETGGTGDLPVACTSNDECQGASVCDCIGRCVAPGIEGLSGCQKDINCGSGNYCDTCSAECRPLKTLCEPCKTDAECDQDGSCLDFQSGGRFCLRACVADVGCPQVGYGCQAVDGQSAKQCVPDSGECAKPALCLDDTECGFGEICDLGTCKPGCPSDDVCPDDHVCSAFRCVPACGEENPCPEGQDCDDGHCKIEGGCLEPADCPEPETYCDLTTNLCADGCLADFDCKASGKECVDGSCVDKGCTANFFCAFGEVCELDTGQCVKAVGPYCEAGCDPQADGSCGDPANQCLTLQDKDGNEVGDFCFVACGPDPLNPCPQGYACQELEHPEKGVLKLCFRDCTFQPLGAE